MGDGRTLIGCFGKNLKRDLLLVRVISLISALPSEASETGEALSPAQRLNVLVQDFFGGRSGWSFRDDLYLVRIFDGKAILRQEARHAFGTDIAAVARIACQHLPPAKVILVNRIHHQHHLPRHALARNILGELFPMRDTFVHMAMNAV